MKPGDKTRVIDELLTFLEGEAGEWEHAKRVLKFLPRRDYVPEGEGVDAANHCVAPGCLVELEWVDPSSPRPAFRILILPQAGGWVARTSEGPIQVLTPQSPLGEKILGARAGAEVEVSLANGGVRRYRVRAFS